MIKPLKSLNVRIPSDLQKELMAISKREKTPLSDLVRESLREFVAVRRFRQIRRKILPLSEVRGILTDEDVFKVVS